MMATRKKYSIDAICDYWDDDIRLNVMGDVCWCCGEISTKLERAHIKALANGGTDTIDNIHLLCANCHRHTEPLEGETYWKYLAAVKWEFKERALQRWFAYQQAGVRLCDTDESDKTGDLVDRALVEISTFEKNNVRGLTIRGLEEAWKNGKKSGQRMQTPKWICEKAIRLWNQGHSYGSIARLFTEEEIPTARSGRWHSMSVKSIIQRGQRQYPDLVRND